MYNIIESGSVWMSCLFIVITRGQKCPNLQPPFLLIALIPTNQTKIKQKKQ